MVSGPTQQVDDEGAAKIVLLAARRTKLESRMEQALQQTPMFRPELSDIHKDLAGVLTQWWLALEDLNEHMWKRAQLELDGMPPRVADGEAGG